MSVNRRQFGIALLALGAVTVSTESEARGRRGGGGGRRGGSGGRGGGSGGGGCGSKGGAGFRKPNGKCADRNGR